MMRKSKLLFLTVRLSVVSFHFSAAELQDERVAAHLHYVHRVVDNLVNLKLLLPAMDPLVQAITFSWTSAKV